MSNLPCFTESELRAFLNGELAGDRLRALAEHLRGCPSCGIAVARLDGVSNTGLEMLRRAAELGENAGTVVQAAGTSPGASSASPQRVGDYEVLGQLGQGGMGVVYKARHVRLRRIVALKQIKGGGGAARETLDRFRREAEAMARLQHRNIVQIFEVGEEEGVPFLVMEFVDGVSLARKLAGTPLPARTAAELLLTLAEAVAHAHQRGVLHRDLTPTNILLSYSRETPASAESSFRETTNRVSRLDEAIPKIADFGLARLLVGGTSLTQTGAVMGTPSYLAPEQADGKGKEAGPAADVYALGAILYECLIGRPPFKAATTLETLKQVVHDDPVPPRQLQPKTPRDLETICLKCLEKSPQRRYAAAEALAHDLGHFLAGESIEARRVGPLGRSWRWGRRRPLVAGLLMLLVFVTVSAFGLVSWQWREAVLERQRAEAEEEEAREQRATAVEERRRAELQEQEARGQRAKAEERLTQACDVIDDMLTRVGADTLASVPHAEAVRRHLLEKAIKAFDGLRQQDSDDPYLRGRTAYAHRRTAELLKQLSKPDEAIPICRTAIDLQERLVAEYPDRADFRAELAISHGTLANLFLDANRLEEADQESKKALDLQLGLVADHPDEARYQHESAVSRTNRAMLLRRLRRPDEAEREQRAAQEIEKRLAERFPNDPRHRYTLASSHYALGNLLNAGKRFPEAREEYRRAVDLLEDLIKENPDLPDYRHLQGQVRHNLAVLLPRDAQEKEVRLARDLHARLVEDYSSVRSYRAQLAWHCDALGGLLKASKPAEAEQAYREALLHRRRLSRDLPDNVEYQSFLGKTLGELATLVRGQRGHLNEARQLFEEAVVHQQAALKASPENGNYRGPLYDHFCGLADTFGYLGDHAEMARVAAELPGLYPDGWPQHFTAGRLFLWGVQLAGLDARLGADERPCRVVGYARQARALLRGALRHEPDNWAVWTNLALVETLLDDGEGYRDTCRDLVKHFADTKNTDTGHWVARTCALAPDAGVDTALSLSLAEKALKTNPGAYEYLTWVGAVLYRAGRNSEALERFESAAKVHHAGGTSYDLFFRAMTHHHLHNAEKAGQCLSEGRRWQGQAEKKELNDPVFGKELWAYQEVELRVLRREAEKLLSAPP